ncbi:class I SAM-dependent methyltransferase [Alkalinema pantanalense CENA528]|uniref:class I SAM-dependent methyltransferase n=1 Tax=Alkalinema pantanalense TaxID=1620705 RepID=UPI003D6ECA1D
MASLMKEHQHIWNSWNQSKGPKYPHEKVIQFVFRNFPIADRAQTRVLDLGCGSGVHTHFLASEGFQAYGCDISEVGVTNTRSRLQSANLVADLQVASLDQLNYEDNFFDLIISCSVFEAAGLATVQKGIGEIYRVLRSGGLGFFLFASEVDFRIQQNNTLGLHGFSQAEVESIFKPLNLNFLCIDRYITTFQNQTFQSNDFLITLKK